MILMALAVVLLSGVAAIVAIWLRVERVRRRATISEVSAWLGRLLREYAPGSVLVAEPNGCDGFLQFALVERRKEQRSIEFGLPESEWSQVYFDAVREMLDSAGTPCTIEEADAGRGPVRRFLRAELRGNRAEVLRALTDLVPRIAATMGHSVEQRYRVSLAGAEAPEYRHEVAARLAQLRSKTQVKGRD